jgi:AraC family transcriptional regulator
MSGKKQLNVKSSCRRVYTEFLPQTPLLSSGKTLWNGISIDQFLLPPGETPEYMLEEFVLAINIGQGFQVERLLSKSLQVGFMAPGTLILCPRHVPQLIRWDREANILLLSLQPELLSRHAEEILDTDQFELISHLITQDQLIHQIGLGLIAQLKSNSSESRLYAESAASFLAVHLLKNYSTQSLLGQEYESRLPPHKLKQAIAYIEEHLAQEISLDRIADELGISRYYFCRLFKQSTRLSPYQYVIQQRVERAKQLLHEGNLSLSDIAIACGFTHQSHLNRHFKRVTGVTPKTSLKS